MLKRMIGILLAVVMAASLICVAGCEEAEKNGGGGNVQTEEPQEDGKDEDVAKTYTVTYYDSDGTTILIKEELAEGAILENKNPGAERAGYTKIWTDKDGNAISFGGSVGEDVSLYLRYELTCLRKWTIRLYCVRILFLTVCSRCGFLLCPSYRRALRLW